MKYLKMECQKNIHLEQISQKQFKDPKLQTSESSLLVTSVQAFLNVSVSFSKKLKLNPGSPVSRAC